MVIKLTQEDIDHSIEACKGEKSFLFVCVECVVARCLRRIFDKNIVVSVTYAMLDSANSLPLSFRDAKNLHLPYELQRYVRLFDSKQYELLKPISVSIPDNELRMAGFIL